MAWCRLFAVALLVALASPALALSHAEQDTTLTVTLVSATYSGTGLDASTELILTGEAPCSCVFGSSATSDDGTAWFDRSATSLNGTPLAPGEGFVLHVGDELSVTLSSFAEATDPGGFAQIETTLDWVVLEASTPLLGDIELEFDADTGGPFELRNDTNDSDASIAFWTDGDHHSDGGIASAGFASFFLHHGETGTVDETTPCAGSFCAGELLPPPTFTLEQARPPSTIRFTHHASSAVALPEPGAAALLAAGTLLLAALRRR